MNSQDFLILNVVCVVFFLLWYWRGRDSATEKPTQLNLRAGDSAPLVIPPEEKTVTTRDSAVGPQVSRGENVQAAHAFAQAKNLNIIFNYNGHSWDAYEVLGVPAGSQISDVTAAYQKALRLADRDSHSFLETAYKAILHRL